MIPHVQNLTSRGAAVSVLDYWKLNRRKFDLQQRYLDKWNNIRSSKTGRQVDVLLMPPMPHTAVPHRSCRWVGYTKVWNFLDYSALVLPGVEVSQTDVNTAWDIDERGTLDAWNATVWRENKERMKELSLPVGIQLVCRKLEEEKLLAAAKVVDTLLRERQN
jgi:amidase